MPMHFVWLMRTKKFLEAFKEKSPLETFLKLSNSQQLLAIRITTGPQFFR
jgi:hypothetical protein